jgi:outer membrane protein assembly factor BamE (lipoprotein component of BamABCDE complex)
MKLIQLSLLALLTIACASKSSQSKINSLEVSEKLLKGETTQSQVLEIFGAPDIVEKTPEGDMWGYNRRTNESGSMSANVTHYISTAAFWNWTGIGLGGSQSSSSTQTASLVLYFGKEKKLVTYTFRTERF